MKRLILALVVVVGATLPSFAAEAQGPDPRAMQTRMMQHPELKKEMLRNPRHLLAMAYHQNLVGFARALEMVAHQGDTVPPEFARAAITEMRRSVAQMEIYQSEAIASMPAGVQAQAPELTRMMHSHLAEMRTHLEQLEQLAKKDRIDAADLLSGLRPLLRGAVGMEGRHWGCDGSGCQGSGCQDRRGDRECDGRDCDCRHSDCRHYRGGHHESGMPDWGQMARQRQQMMQEMKTQDAELANLVDRMNRAPRDQKQDLMAEILTRMVQQRAAAYRHLEQMRQHWDQGDGMTPDQGSEDEDTDDTDSDDSD